MRPGMPLSHIKPHGALYGCGGATRTLPMPLQTQS